MVTSRFYRPQMAALSKKEKVFVGLAEEAGLTYFVPDELMTRRIADFAGADGKAQVTYSFSRAIRRNLFPTRSGSMDEYGVSGISFRLLYEFLCEAFNAGEYFIDTYFRSLFDTRPVSDELNQINDSILADIEAEKEALELQLVHRVGGELDMRYNVNKRYTALQAWRNPVRRASDVFAVRVRQQLLTSAPQASLLAASLLAGGACLAPITESPSRRFAENATPRPPRGPPAGPAHAHLERGPGAGYFILMKRGTRSSD